MLEGFDSPHSSQQTLLEVKGIEKKFGSVHALRGVDFDLLSGEVHGLLGANGAGKSTLIKILAGIEKPSSGTMNVVGSKYKFMSIADSKAAGIAIVHQSLSLVPSLTVAQNLFLGDETLKYSFLLDSASINRKAAKFLELYQFPIHPNQIVADLTFAYRQLVEIGKALIKDAKVLILDEPTSSLSNIEKEILFSAILDAKKKGIGIIYVSHRLSEIMEITDRVTVLRDGKKVGTSKTNETDLSNLIHLIVGEKKILDNVSNPLEENKVNPSDEKVLEVRNFSNDRVKNVNLDLRKGEILGLVGGIGSGRTELLESLFGIRKKTSGEIWLDGELTKIRNIQESIHAGIKLVPEDRHKFGLILEHDIEHNNAMTMAETLRRNLLIFSHRRSRKYAENAVNKLSIKTSSIFNFMSELSGGNQQKVVLGKWLHANTKVLLLDEPTAGVDVGARAEIYEIIRQLASQGTAILICSSDFDELFQLCSSFAFIRDGEVSQIFESSLIKTENDLHAKLENREWESSNV